MIAMQRQTRGPGRWRRAVVAAAAGALLACGAVDEGKLPPNVQDPATLKTPSGAVARYRGAVSQLPGTVDHAIVASAVITDELAGLPALQQTFGPYTPVDSRTDLSSLSAPNFNRLHRLRGQAHEARGFLAAYAPDSSPALQGHLLALEAYAEVWLADLFCSGIPLSTVDFDGNYTTTPGFTTSEVYRHAAALFDSALALTGDSVRFQQLAAVGKGRALLALGRYAEAAAAVSAVPDDYVYQVPFAIPAFFDTQNPTPADSGALWSFAAAFRAVPNTPSVADREGGHGLDFRSSGDPRSAAAALDAGPRGDSMYVALKYPTAGQALYPLASGLEARLIEAEAALQSSPADGHWLELLNHLRQTQWPTIAPAIGGPLPDLADPGSVGARVDLLFRERALWLYLTGHREGDLRRLIRNYGRDPQTVYPAGQYPGGTGAYGTEIVIPAPESERELNAQYTGCFHRNA